MQCESQTFQEVLSRRRQKKPKKFFNCSGDPLSVFPQATAIITWCRFPELHLHLHINWYLHRMERVHPAIVEWYQHFNQTRSDFHGGDFAGPQIRRLSRPDSMQYLKTLLKTTSAAPDTLLYYNAMAAFIELENRCFSKKIHAGGYAAELSGYKAACLRLPTKKVPMKMHVIVAHLDRCLRETGRGLGSDSEQSFEAAHHDFANIWRRYKVRDVTSDMYAFQLRRAVLTFNALHSPITA